MCIAADAGFECRHTVPCRVQPAFVALPSYLTEEIPAATVMHVALQCKQQRHQLCVKLGLGPCDGKQLLQQLNRFGFSRAEVEEALKDLAP